MLEFGFLEISGGQELPPDDQQNSADILTGSAIRYGLDSTHNFLTDLAEHT